jgi:hypothetical protein
MTGPPVYTHMLAIELDLASALVYIAIWLALAFFWWRA